MRFPDGVEAEFEAALDRPDDAGVELVGSGGSATLADPWHCLSPGIAIGDGGTIAVAPADPYRLQLDDFAAAVREGRPALVSGERDRRPSSRDRGADRVRRWRRGWGECRHRGAAAYGPCLKLFEVLGKLTAVERTRIERATSWLQTRCSPS